MGVHLETYKLGYQTGYFYGYLAGQQGRMYDDRTLLERAGIPKPTTDDFVKSLGLADEGEKKNE